MTQAFMTTEEFAALPAVDAFVHDSITKPDGTKMVIPRMRPLKMVWVAPDEPVGYIIDGFWWAKAEDENGRLVRVRGRSA